MVASPAAKRPMAKRHWLQPYPLRYSLCLLFERDLNPNCRQKSRVEGTGLEGTPITIPEPRVLYIQYPRSLVARAAHFDKLRA